MTAFLIPKPAKRGPRPRTRLRRSPPLRRSRRVRRVRAGRVAELRREAERLCSRITLKAFPLCECRCGRPSTDAAHILNKKAWPRVRYYLRNLVALNRVCHEYYGDAAVSLTKPSPLRDLVLSKPGGRERWEMILLATAGPRLDIVEVVEGLRMVAYPMGIK